MSQKRALITGITGQDGAYLAQYLLELGYEVFGGYRRSSGSNFWRLDELGITDQVSLMSLDLLEYSNIQRVLDKTRPTEVYNLAAQSYVAVSFEQPIYTAEVDALGVARLLEAVRVSVPKARFYQASTSEMFGKVQSTPQTESTPFYPRSPYAVAKLYAHWMTVNYREGNQLFACSGILFNHESPLRGAEFVTRKITKGFARLACGSTAPVGLGNLDAKRDWGFAGDYVRGMWLMLQQDIPQDFVLSTGESHSVRQFAEAAAAAAGFQLEWQQLPGSTEVGVDRLSGRRLVEVDPAEFRPSEVDILLGDSSMARRILGWKPEVNFAQLVDLMVQADLKKERNAVRPISIARS